MVDGIRRLRATDPLGRITVIVASFGAARDLVRALALTGGAVNVAVRTAAQVIAELSGPALAPRAPLPFPLLEAAVEKALDADPGQLRAVASEPVTAQAVAQACLRLGTVAPGSVSAVFPLHAEVLRLSEQAHSMTGGAYYPQAEAVDAALARLDDLGHVVRAAPLRGTTAERRLGEALDASGITPVPGTGADHLASATEPDGPGVVTGTHVLHASDSDDEIRAVVRFVRSRLADGIPGHRIGVYYPSPDPYLRLALRAFTEAGIAVSGPSITSLGRTPVGRSLTRLLGLDPVIMPRAELLSIVAEGAVMLLDDAGKPVSSRRLEQLTRTRVPVIGGSDWDRLAEHLEHLGLQADQGSGSRSAPTGPALTRSAPTGSAPDDSVLSDSDRAAAAAVLRLVGRVRAALGALERARTWSEVVATVEEVLTSLFRQNPDRAAVLSAVSSLADLDTVSPVITRDRIVGALTTRMDSISDRVGEEGAGVAVGPIDDAVGRDLDTVCVVGMAEGLLPVLYRPDPLLPEGAVEPPATELLDERYRVLQLALTAGATHRVCSFPRGSMRGGGSRIPSRWLLPTLSRLADVKVHATRWQTDVAACPTVTAIPSFIDGVLDPPAILGSDPATSAELCIRGLAAAGWRPGPDSPRLLTRAHEMRRDRRRGIFSRFTGDVSSVSDLVSVLDHPVSPTRLEDWAQSPYLFFLGAVLRVRPLDDPAADIEMDLREYGDLVHSILRRYVSQRLERGGAPDRELLMSALRDECEEAVAAAPGLLAPLWRRRQMLLAAELGRWFDEDTSDAEDGWLPTATELGFGREAPGTPAAEARAVEARAVKIPFEVTTSRGPWTLLLAGSIDRLDTRAGTQRVTDYKTGTPPARDQRPTADDPTLTGTRFQLPLYAAAAASARDMPVSEVRYWYCTERGGFEQISLTISESLMERVRADVGNLVDAIQRGWFPLKGGRGSSRDLADLLGGADLDRTWERLSRREPLASHPAFAGLVADARDDSGSDRSS